MWASARGIAGRVRQARATHWRAMRRIAARCGDGMSSFMKKRRSFASVKSCNALSLTAVASEKSIRESSVIVRDSNCILRRATVGGRMSL